LSQRFALLRVRLSEAIKRLKGASLAKFQDHLYPRDPIGAVAMDQVADDIEGSPGIAAFIAKRPHFRQIAQKRIEGARSVGKKSDCVLQIVVHNSRTWRT